MSEITYRQTLIQTVEKLNQMRTGIFDQLFQLAATGELKAWAESVPAGECHTIDKAVFAGCEDANLQILLRLLTRVEQTKDALCILNALDFPGEHGIDKNR